MRHVGGWTVLLAMVLAVSLLVLQGPRFASLLLLVGGAASAWLMWRRWRRPERGAERQPGLTATRESWTASGGEPVVPDVAPDAAEFARARVPSDVAEPAQTAREDPRERRPPSTALDRAFNLLFALYVTSVILWLVAGLVPTVAHTFPSVHHALHRWGQGSGLLAEIARNAARASHNAYGLGLASAEYLLSAVNLGLGMFLVVRGPRQPAARLLAIGMVGTAVAFNLQGHWARQVVPTGWLGPIEIWHILFVHVLSGVSYVLALLLFPDGKLAHPKRLPLLVVLMVVFVMLSLITTEDHTFGLVLVFGLFIPIAGVISQAGRFRRAVSDRTRRQTRVVLFGLVLASATALGLIGVSAAFSSGPEGVTRVYELGELPAGTYFFRCDPHPDTMTGAVVVAPASGSARPVPDAAPVVVGVDAENGKFDQGTLTLPEGRDVQLRFTNRDGDGHNVAIYTDQSARESLFVGDVFSGDDVTARAFRVFQPVFVVIPLTLFFGLLRFRLWRFERVIHKALVYGFLAAFITVVYAAVVVGIGRTVGNGSSGDLVLPVVATAIVAVAFEPLRLRLQRLANVLVYGKRASPYEVLADFSDRMAGSLSIDEVLPQMVEAAARGVGAARGRVHVLLPDGGERAVTWPEGTEEATEEAFDRALIIRHKGEPVGGVWVAKPPGDTISPEEDRLLEDLASQAGLALQNVRLTGELQTRLREISAQAAELRTSRQRIVAAQDAASRRLERNIHDGIQQHLVALTVKLRLLGQLASRDPARTAELASELQTEATEALEDLRDLARGIYPPLLADQGLPAALEAQARKAALPVSVQSDGIGRYPQDVESALYFCCLEALQNVAKYAHATHAEIRLSASSDELAFEVIDDGDGFDPSAVRRGSGLQGMADRLDAIGGTLQVRSQPGMGTTVTGRVPV